MLIAVMMLVPAASGASPQGIPVKSTPFDAKFRFSEEMSGTSQTMKDAAPESLKILFFKAKGLRYFKEKGRDHWQTPEETEINGYGDCEDKAIWLFKKLRENRYQNARVVVGKLKEGYQGYHAWVEYTDATGVTHILDASTQAKIWKRQEVTPSYFVPYFSYDEKIRYMHPVR